MKIYTLIRDDRSEDESTVTAKPYLDLDKARADMKAMVDDFKELEDIYDEYSDWEVEEGEDSFSAYLDGEECLNHYYVRIQTDEV